MNEGKIRIGVLGCANIAVRSMMPELQRHPAFELVAIASRSSEKAGILAQDYSCGGMTYDELVGHPAIDAIYVPLPTGLHAEWVGKCLLAGKHVLCEKSLGCSLDEVAGMIALARERRLLLMENFQFRFHSQHLHVKRMLASGVLGEIRGFRSAFGFPPFADGAANIRYQKELGGGALLDAGAYTLKATVFMLGGGFQVKAATLRFESGFDVDLGGAAYLERQDGLVSQVAFGFDNFYQCNYEIWGSRGKLTVTRAFTAPPGFPPEILIETADGMRVEKLPADNHFQKVLTHFATSIVQKEYETEYEECLVQAFLLAAVKEVDGAR